MTDQKKPRRFWIDPARCDDDEDDFIHQHDAFSEKPTQGNQQWIYNLIPVIEVMPVPTPEEIHDKAMRYGNSQGWGYEDNAEIDFKRGYIQALKDMGY